MATTAGWRKWLPWCIGAGDVLVIVFTIASAQFVRFGTEESVLAAVRTPYWLIGAAIGGLWLIALAVWRAWEIRIVGSGPGEYLRVASSTLAVFGGIAIVSYVFGLELARGYVAVAVPVGVLTLLAWRWIARKLIVHFRRRGYLTRRLVIIGGPGEVLQLYRSFARAPGAGFNPVGAILPGRSLSSPSGDELPLPILSVDRSVDGIVTELLFDGIEVVAVTGGGLSPSMMRALSWQLAEHEISLVLAPALTDIAGPRIHSHPVADLPLIHVSTPRLSGTSVVLKRAFDIIGALLAIVLATPILLLTAIAIKLDDGGPVLFTQRRVGKDRRPFVIYKFRSMVVDAEDKLTAVTEIDSGNVVLFKSKEDPRVTRVGKFIRKYSIDELPQLFNVLFGSMSMVGPRPPLESEVEQYEAHVMRRLAVLPGITGLWQIGGRSDLDWDESVRLDLYYVENWSIFQDLVILVRTVRIVLKSQGAY